MDFVSIALSFHVVSITVCACVCVKDMDRVAMLHRRMRGAGGIGPMYGAGRKHFLLHLCSTINTLLIHDHGVKIFLHLCPSI